MKKDRITVVVPCFNEQESLPLFYNEICKVSEEMKEKADFTFLFIDDGSNDHTLQFLRQLNETDSRVHFISFSRNFGKEAAIFAGLQHADSEYTVVMDADLQHPPAFIPQMYDAVASGEFDCAATCRLSRKGEKPIRSFFASLFYKWNNRLSSTKIVEGGQDFRFMSRKVVEAVLQLSETNRFTKGIFNWVGFQTKYIPYENVERAAGQSKWSFYNLLRYSLEGILAFTTAPLLLPLLFGGILLAVGVGCLLATLISSLPCIYAVLCFLVGIQLVCLGIVAQYFAKMYWEVKKRPIYIAKEMKL
ncbi:MAG: glycosyltransferase family 2 protein [Candidatus Merdivicinus sp.]|jgi:glucosyltransferase